MMRDCLQDMEVRFAATAFDVESRDRSVHLTNWSQVRLGEARVARPHGRLHISSITNTCLSLQVKHESAATCRPAEVRAELA